MAEVSDVYVDWNLSIPWIDGMTVTLILTEGFLGGFFGFFFCIPQLYLWGSPLLGEIFAYVTVFESNH